MKRKKLSEIAFVAWMASEAFLLVREVLLKDFAGNVLECSMVLHYFPLFFAWPSFAWKREHEIKNRTGPMCSQPYSHHETTKAYE